MDDLTAPDTLSTKKRRAVSEASVDKCKIEERLDALRVKVDNLALSECEYDM
ncbi:hypothetical protein PROFUN_09935 [Planoprotostelium fungivorum]|uniref:Uncharacterized protein n=1 Tax=Planoprotostelium fungivorum TaxID=1890364 RepID=A0A2P6NGA4_9EUKA|nr:hypothetical protein PROFUN_09935 [Planoprotostelium fungivorum]